VAKFLADMKKYQPTATLDERTETGWAAMMLFDKVTASLTSFSPATVMQAMKSVTTPIDLGIVGPWKSAGATSPIKLFPQLGFNPTVAYGVVKNGQIVADQTKGFPNPFVNLASGK
jgi:branched-chain amino acid transport system substrate-binding protein